MKSPFEKIDKAFFPLEEPLKWIQDKAPHTSSTFYGVVLQGSMETMTAGVQVARITADSWTVRLPSKSLLVDKMTIGDMIERGCWKSTVLTIQQVYQDASGDYWLLCTAEERVPNT